MRKLVFIMITTLILAIPLVSNAVSSGGEKPMVYAVMMYADWCGTCKALDPKITQAREIDNLDSKNVLFVNLDLTDETSNHQAAMMAAALGITELYESNAGKTGFMLLINAETGEKISRITNKLDAKSISEHITDAINVVTS